MALASSEGDDAADGVVWRDAYGDPVTGNDLDAKTTHTTTQLSKYLVARVALHSIEPAAVHRHNDALYVDEIVLSHAICLLDQVLHIGPKFAKASSDFIAS